MRTLYVRYLPESEVSIFDFAHALRDTGFVDLKILEEDRTDVPVLFSFKLTGDTNQKWFSAKDNSEKGLYFLKEYPEWLEKLKNPNAYLVLDFSNEGWSAREHTVGLREFFDPFPWLMHKTIYVTGANNAGELERQMPAEVPRFMKTLTYQHWNSITTFSDVENYDVTSYKNREKVFLSLNRRIRPHRVAMVGAMIENNLLPKSFVSFHHEDDLGRGTRVTLPWIAHELNEEIAKRAIASVETLGGKDLTVDGLDPKVNPISIGQDAVEFYRRSYISVVNETFGFHKTVFHTEKIMRAFVYKHPFIVVSAPNYLKGLREVGFKTFHPFIDETYDTIEDGPERYNAIVKELIRLSKMNSSELDAIMRNVKPMVDFNFKFFHTKKLWTLKTSVMELLKFSV